MKSTHRALLTVTALAVSASASCGRSDKGGGAPSATVVQLEVMQGLGLVWDLHAPPRHVRALRPAATDIAAPAAEAAVETRVDGTTGADVYW